MNKSKYISAALTVLASVLMSTNASAKEHKVKNPDNLAKVVAHLSFQGQAPLNMAMQKQGDDKYFLYVQHDNNGGVSVVDVGKATRPRTIGEVADPSLVSAVNLTGNLAVVSQTQMTSMPNAAPKSDLVLWDLSSPTEPRVVQKFSGVVKWLEDDRNFIYVLNNEGLWVISQPEEQSWQPDVMSVPLYE